MTSLAARGAHEDHEFAVANLKVQFLHCERLPAAEALGNSRKLDGHLGGGSFDPFRCHRGEASSEQHLKGPANRAMLD
ncbi:MAG TPA: hypothetical protein DEG43_07105 [Acidimicrobiaceae bacterium]|nr:hypothetical protein [Acidimicrobiaceae bacterium]